MKSYGYSLLEVMVASTILGVVSLLGFVVLKSSNEAAQLSTAKVDVQNHLRDSMAVMSGELREAVSSETTNRTGAPEGLYSIAVDETGNSVTFQVPEPVAGEEQFAYSTPITYSLVNEDVNGNGLLDEGEDANEDGVLTRRIVRTQDGVEVPVASANSIDTVTFQLVANQATGNRELTTVNIQLTGSKRYGPGEGKLVVSELESSIRLVN